MADSVTFGSISHGQMSFHNWLIQSRYVNGGDDLQGRRRKGKARSTKGEEHDPRNAQAHSHAVIASSLMLPPDALPLSGKRKARRWVNERLLKDMAGPLTGPDVTSLYAPPPWGEKTERPVLERLSDVSLATPFEAFVCQQYLAGATFNKLPSRKAKGKSKREQEQAGTGDQQSVAAAGAAAVAASQAAWKRVPEAARGAMRRAADWAVVGSVESLLVAFLQPPAAAAAAASSAAAATVAADATTATASSAVGTACSGNGDINPSTADGSREGSSTAPCAAGLAGGGGEEEQEGQQEVQQQPQQEGVQQELEGGEREHDEHGGLGSVLPDWCVQAAWGDVESALGAHGVKGGAAERGVLVFAAEDAFLRLLLHGMCQFHGMRSLSLPAPHLPAHLLLAFPPHLAPSTLTVAWLPLALPSLPPATAAPAHHNTPHPQPQSLASPPSQDSSSVTADHFILPSHHVRLHHILPACPLPVRT
ncbi:hypothetical protein CLOM_g4804 [Closterium sp. NIES-68]|nr:hypothetical protein CLOM_g4804 [Closterium sp. NIES-68]GJP60278.1 hypothetical protein CLOP_g17489 [Closterium sp. NIES-67]